VVSLAVGPDMPPTVNTTVCPVDTAPGTLHYAAHIVQAVAWRTGISSWTQTRAKWSARRSWPAMRQEIAGHVLWIDCHDAIIYVLDKCGNNSWELNMNVIGLLRRYSSMIAGGAFKSWSIEEQTVIR
jgi:hypothetical protein